MFSAAHDSSPSIPPVLYQKLFMIWSIMALLPCLVCCDRLETAENEELLPLTGVTHCRRGMVFLMVTGSPGDGKNSRNVQTINSDPLLVPQASNSPQGQPKGGISLHSSPVLLQAFCGTWLHEPGENIDEETEAMAPGWTLVADGNLQCAIQHQEDHGSVIQTLHAHLAGVQEASCKAGYTHLHCCWRLRIKRFSLRHF